MSNKKGKRGTKNEQAPSRASDWKPNYYAGLAGDISPEAPAEAVLDSGATHTFFPSTYKSDHEVLNRPNEGILVGCAREGVQLQSYAQDEAIWPTIPRRACKGHKLKHLTEALASVRRFVESGCDVHFGWDKALIIDRNTKETLLEAPCNASKGLYTIPLDTTTKVLPTATQEILHESRGTGKAYTLNNYTIPAVPQMIKFLHAAAGYPVISSWLQAIKKDHYMSWPGLCAETVRKHLQDSPITSKGHMKMVRQNRHPKPDTQVPLLTANAIPPAPIKTAHNIEFEVIETAKLPNDITTNTVLEHQLGIIKTEGKYVIKNLISTDLPGRYPVTSARGYKYIFILYNHDTNFIHACPIKSRKAEDLILGFTTCYAEMKQNGFTATKLKLDNEISKLFIHHIKDVEKIDYQQVSAGNHRTNQAERAILDFKNHFISILSGADPDFPTNCWDLLLPQTIITLNLLRDSRLQPKLSAYAQVHGPFNFKATPLGPAGCKAIIHERTAERPSWGDHATDRYYIGPAMQHYKNYELYMPATRATRKTDTIKFFPHHCTIPQVNANDRFVLAVQDLTQVLTDPSPFPFLESASNQVTLKALQDALLQTVSVARVKSTLPYIQHKPTVKVPRVPSKTPRQNKPVTRTTLHKIGTIARKKFNRGHYEGEVIGYNDNNGYYKIKYEDGDLEEYDTADMSKYYKHLQKYSSTPNALSTLKQYDTNFNYNLFPIVKRHQALAAGGTIWDPTLQKMAHYRDYIVHPNPKMQQRWIQGGENEFGRLFSGYGEVEGMNVCEWVQWDAIPKDKVVTYARYTVVYRPEKTDEPFRVRITAGGDRLIYDGPVSTQVAGMEIFKLLLNSTISTEGAKMVTGDISNMYLESFLKDAEYMRFKVNQIPPNIIRHYKLEKLIRHGFVYAKIN